MRADPLMSSDKSDWRTPLEFLGLVRKVGPIMLDPCTSEQNPVGATFFYTSQGTVRSWRFPGTPGLVYANPPYGDGLGFWTEKMRIEASKGAEIVALLPARTDTEWFQPLWFAQALCFWKGRIKFVGAKSGAPFPSVVAYWGPHRHTFHNVFCDRGHVVYP